MATTSAIEASAKPLAANTSRAAASSAVRVVAARVEETVTAPAWQTASRRRAAPRPTPHLRLVRR